MIRPSTPSSRPISAEDFFVPLKASVDDFAMTFIDADSRQVGCQTLLDTLDEVVLRGIARQILQTARPQSIESWHRSAGGLADRS